MDEDIELGGRQGRDYRTEIPADDDEMMEDGYQLINLHKFQHLVPYIIAFAIIIFLMRGMVTKRDRRGCTIIVLFVFVICYFFNRCVHL